VNYISASHYTPGNLASVNSSLVTGQGQTDYCWFVVVSNGIDDNTGIDSMRDTELKVTTIHYTTMARVAADPECQRTYFWGVYASASIVAENPNTVA
jgi:hypothetical protein